MYSQYFGFQEEPFGATPDPRWLYRSAKHREALASLRHGFYSNRGFTALIAPPGLGKTTLLYQFLHDIRNSARIVFLFDTQCEPLGLLRYILRDLGISAAAHRDEMHAQLEEVLIKESRAGRRVLVVVDEAQNLQDEALEMLRLLTNYETPQAKLLHIVLSGQPLLADTLMKPSMEQLRQRVSTTALLEPFSMDETTAYIRHRLEQAGYKGAPLFRKEALRRIMVASHGVPRIINNLCFNALSLCCEHKLKQVDGDLAAEAIAIQELEPESREKILHRWEVAAGQPLRPERLPQPEEPIQPEERRQPETPFRFEQPIQAEQPLRHLQALLPESPFQPEGPHRVEQPIQAGLPLRPVQRPEPEFPLEIEEPLRPVQSLQTEQELRFEQLLRSEQLLRFVRPIEPEKLFRSEGQLQLEELLRSEESLRFVQPLEPRRPLQAEQQFETEQPHQIEEPLQLEESLEPELLLGLGQAGEGEEPKPLLRRLTVPAAALLLVASGIGLLSLSAGWQPGARLTGYIQSLETKVQSASRTQSSEPDASRTDAEAPSEEASAQDMDDLTASTPAPATANIDGVTITGLSANPSTLGTGDVPLSIPSLAKAYTADAAITEPTVKTKPSASRVRASAPSLADGSGITVAEPAAKTSEMARKIVLLPITAPAPSNMNRAAVAEHAGKSKSFQITAEPNQTLHDICLRYLGVWDVKRLHEIQALNPNLTDLDHIEAGQKIRLPAPEPAPMGQPSTAPAHLNQTPGAGSSAGAASTPSALIRNPAASNHGAADSLNVVRSAASEGLPSISGAGEVGSYGKVTPAGIPGLAKGTAPASMHVAPIPADMFPMPTSDKSAEQDTPICGGVVDIPCPKLKTRPASPRD